VNALHICLFCLLATNPLLLNAQDACSDRAVLRLADLAPEHKPSAADLAILRAAEQNDLSLVKQALAKGANVDALNTNGWSPLIFAAKAGNAAMVRTLVAKGADVNRRTSTDVGSTVLCFAVDRGDFSIVAYLLKHGADINGKSRNGTTPLSHTAITGKIEAAKFLLDQGADIELLGQIDDKGSSYTPLMSAAYSGHVDLVKLFLAKGAKLDATNNNGDTALMLVAKKPHSAVVKLLIERGANVNARLRRGHTALIYAAYNGHTENVRLLLAAGADPSLTATDQRDPDAPYGRYTASDLAEGRGHNQIVALIAETRAAAASKTADANSR